QTASWGPANKADLKHWLMYLYVLRCIVAVKYVDEWLATAVLPLKALFLLYLTLPQTSGFVWLYVTHLFPFFEAHEYEVDALTLSQLK
ncbi:uncharacterized protein BXZ73DRAFT_20993, partial [Epithele typhae]|uniref:uncharacterized protein n=1 Tax=Epithele typhae TaxID=378194 RepID=UPI002008DD97